MMAGRRWMLGFAFALGVTALSADAQENPGAGLSSQLPGNAVSETVTDRASDAVGAALDAARNADGPPVPDPQDAAAALPVPEAD